MRLVMNEGHEHQVYGKMLRAGDVFEVPDHEGRVWILVGRARAVTQKISTKVVEAESEPVEEKKQSKRYNRRDMRAEDE